MGRRWFKPGDRVKQLEGEKDGKKLYVYGIVTEYIYPHPFHTTYGYVEILFDDGSSMFGSADEEIKKA